MENNLLNFFCFRNGNQVYINCSMLNKNMLNDNLKIHIIKVLKGSLEEDEQFDIYIDLSGLTMSMINIDFMTELINIFSAIFPNKLRKCELKNYPSFFKNVYNLVENFIDKVTRNKIIWIKNKNCNLTY